MKVYKIKSRTGKIFWSIQLPIENSEEEVLGETDITEDFVKDLEDEDKNYLILELTQALKFSHVEERIAELKKRKKRKPRKTIL